MAMELLNNPPAAWGNAAIAFGATVAALYGARGFLVHKAQRFAAKTANRIDDVAGAMLASTHLLAIVLLAAYAGSLLLALTDRQALFTRRAMICVVLVQAALWADVGVRTWRRDTAGPGADATSTSVVCVVLRTAIWTVALLMMLDNLGFNISTLVASLGVGGIAVALAVQNILGDLFASLSITFDKPFVVGDFIIVDNELGEVEFIGLKTTRIRALGGEQIVFSNADLLKSRIHNHKRMLSRRAAFVVRVAYGVDEDRLAALPAMVREIVEAQANTRFERAHFSAYGEWSLDFEVVYHVASPDYLMFMDIQQAIYLALYARFRREGIRFAHPLHVLRLDGDGMDEPPRRAAEAVRPTRH
jgi:small-conductance mechanosensitive channel